MSVNKAEERIIVLAQNENTCIVYGMPKAVVENNLADKVLPIESNSWRNNKILCLNYMEITNNMY